jgi:hypothetical protein
LSVTYILIALIAMFGHSEDFLGTTLLSRPLVLGPLVGLVLGDINQGIIIGASLELIFMGNIKVGAAIPPDVVTAGVLGAAFLFLLKWLSVVYLYFGQSLIKSSANTPKMAITKVFSGCISSRD